MMCVCTYSITYVVCAYTVHDVSVYIIDAYVHSKCIWNVHLYDTGIWCLLIYAHTLYMCLMYTYTCVDAETYFLEFRPYTKAGKPVLTEEAVEWKLLGLGPCLSCWQPQQQCLIHAGLSGNACIMTL